MTRPTFLFKTSNESACGCTRECAVGAEHQGRAPGAGDCRQRNDLDRGVRGDATMPKVKLDKQQVQASMEKIYQAQDPQEQQRLMREHMQQMRETMRSMGGEMHGRSMCCGN